MIIGVKESSFINKIFTMVNITVLSFIIITGATKANFNNWAISVDVMKFFFKQAGEPTT
jgi:hypothetical protein